MSFKKEKEQRFKGRKEPSVSRKSADRAGQRRV
jgi:hypothetical protein